MKIADFFALTCRGDESPYSDLHPIWAAVDEVEADLLS